MFQIKLFIERLPQHFFFILEMDSSYAYIIYSNDYAGPPKNKRSWGNRLITYDKIQNYFYFIPKPSPYNSLLPEVKELWTLGSAAVGTTPGGVLPYWTVGANNGQRIGNKILIIGIKLSMQMQAVYNSYSYTMVITKYGIAVDRQLNGSSTYDLSWWNPGPGLTTSLGSFTQMGAARHAFLDEQLDGLSYMTPATVKEIAIPTEILTTFGTTSNYPLTNCPWVWWVSSDTSGTTVNRFSFVIYYIDS
jgi:hypothetical protein